MDTPQSTPPHTFPGGEKEEKGAISISMTKILPQSVSKEPVPEPLSRAHALIMADAILNILHGYPRKGSRVRHNSYQRDLNWLANVLLAVADL